MIYKLSGQSPKYYVLYEILRKLEMITRMAPNISWNTGGTVITTTTAAPITTTTTTVPPTTTSTTTAFVFDSNYQATLDQATALTITKPNAAQQTLHNNLISTIKTGLGASWGTKVKRFYLPANNGSTEFGTLNWVSPTTSQAIISSSPTWTSNRGWLSNGTSHVRIPFVTSEYAGIQTNLSVVAYSSRINDSDLNLNFFGFQTDGSRTFRLRTKVFTDVTSSNHYSSTSITEAAVTRGGLYHLRCLTADFATFRNNTKSAHATTGNFAPTAGGGDLGWLCYNSTANAGTFTASTMTTGEYGSFMLIAEGLTDAEHTVIYNAFETYRAAISLT